MLNKTPTFSIPAELPAILSGQSISKSARYRTVRQRARTAASWVVGGTYVRPTTKLAASVFQCSAALVAEEVAKIQNKKPPVTPVDSIWTAMGGAERDAFVRRHLPDIWVAVEHATATDD